MFVAFVATFGAFLPALEGAFLNWDDNKNFLENPHYRGLRLENLRWMFTTFHLGPWQPLSWLTLGLDYTLWEMEPRGYHLTSLVIHSLNAVLFLLLARMLFDGSVDSKRRGDGKSRNARPGSETALALAALASALLFSVHPLRVESVAWITERRDVLSGFFFLLFLLAYLESVRRRGAPGESVWRLSALAAFGCSLLSKATGVTAPFVLIILDVYPLRRLPGDPRRWTSPEYRRVLAEKVPYLLVGVVVGLVAVIGQHATGALKGLEEAGVAERIGLTFYAIAFYLQKTILPVGLSPLYMTPPDFDAMGAPVLRSLAAAAVLTGLFWFLHRRWPAALAAWLAYLIIVFPLSGVARSGDQLAADRYTYMACMPWPLLAGAGVLLAGRRLGKAGPLRLAPPAIALALAVVLGALTWVQSSAWRTSATLWGQALKVDPDSPLAAMNLASSLVDEGRLDEAVRVCRELLIGYPSHVQARYNLGLNLAILGRTAEARAEFERLTRETPTDPAGFYGMGILLWQQGRAAEARSYLEQVLRLEPDHLLALQALREIDASEKDPPAH